jgi:PST family polysaccharide transporter
VTQKSSYAQILKSSTIMGGAAGINLLLGMVRTKFAAVLIGTTGVGLLASFTAIQGIVGAIAGLGIQSSAVREIAAAVGQGDEQAIGRAVLTLRRVCWLTGLTGMGTMIALSPWLSQLTFGSEIYTLDIAALGIVILFGNLSGGQLALIQGMRRIGDMARANVYGAIFATLAAVGFYVWLGLRGIVPTLVSVAAMQLVLSWRFARRVPVPRVSLGWGQTFREASGMVRLGLVFMINGLMGSAVSYFTVTLITQKIGVQAVGIYSAAFALSGMFVNFVLGAMGADYYPRLTSVAHDKAAINRLVNEQTEIGLLLAIPGLLATMVLAPWIVRVFYTSEFLPAVELLQWFVMGCLGRVISWPLGFVMLAMGKSAHYGASEMVWNFLHATFIFVGVELIGVTGVAIAFFALYVVVTLQAYIIVRHLSGFFWSHGAKKLMLSSMFVFVSFVLVNTNSTLLQSTVYGVLVFTITCFYCTSEVLLRLPDGHKLLRLAKMLRIKPGAKNNAWLP